MAMMDATSIAFRQLVFQLSQRLTWHERRALVYMRLFKDREKYKEAGALQVLVRLEADGFFSASNPAGLLAIARDVKRPDLEKKVTKFMDTYSKKLPKRVASEKKVHEEPTQSSTNMLSETLREEVMRLLSLVTVLTEQCSWDYGTEEDFEKKQERAYAGAWEAKKTVRYLMQALRRVEDELESCELSLTPSLPPRAPQVSCDRVRQPQTADRKELPQTTAAVHSHSEMTRPRSRTRTQKQVLPAIPDPQSPPSGALAEPKGVTRKPILRRPLKPPIATKPSNLPYIKCATHSQNPSGDLHKSRRQGHGRDAYPGVCVESKTEVPEHSLLGDYEEIDPSIPVPDLPPPPPPRRRNQAKLPPLPPPHRVKLPIPRTLSTRVVSSRIRRMQLEDIGDDSGFEDIRNWKRDRRGRMSAKISHRAPRYMKVNPFMLDEVGDYCVGDSPGTDSRDFYR